MEPFNTHSGIVAPLDRINVDTDAIIPKQFLKKTDKTGFGQHLFHELRYTDYEGTQENPDFVLNKKPYRKATILLARDNFGCGSSREHAPWALGDFGFRAIIAPSFADIFANNCVKNGILLAKLEPGEVDELFKFTGENPGVTANVDLEAQRVNIGGRSYTFPMKAFSKDCLLKGLDSIGWTMQFNGNIESYMARMRAQKPWLEIAR